MLSHSPRNSFVLFLVGLATLTTHLSVAAFTLTPTTCTRCSIASSSLFESTASSAQGEGFSQEQQQQQQQQSQVEMFLAEYYPSFFNLVMCNAVDVLKALRQSQDDMSSSSPSFVTIFAPNDGAFEALGDKKIQQLRDPRNLETCSKIAAYHVIRDDDQLVTAELILDEESNIGGVVTMAGEVPVGPSQSGGFFMGLGARDDGGVVVGPDAKIVQSTALGPTTVVHEVDGLVAPNLIWRYMDQLRLPGL